MSEYCKGCAVFSAEDKACSGAFNLNGQCPCTDCIIKTMCENECKSYRGFINNLLIHQQKIRRDENVII